jgi:hypothetical protein
MLFCIIAAFVYVDKLLLTSVIQCGSRHVLDSHIGIHIVHLV